ncbi:hypothetical protein PRIPAC_95453 [Pristionchus pacificus]|uniref:acid phosphatase n=1 Tax=Pristionchus pacificus TaxID=54126 RepID=A0A2A6D2F8_PRIPA|nr:hypothetical protein PRIPAC_95453 [Pristionchus pacificus]|eukprot:PDM84471.1 Phosphatase [Pristionchus pacificus]
MLRVAAVCLLVASVSAIRFPSDREKIEEWAKWTMVRQLEEATPVGLDLAHVSVVYRHGDRSPTSAMPGDKTTEEFWTFGGGGWGELSPIGMRQLYKLGKKLYGRYADGSKFLSDTYKAKEMFVHCTDKNRTVVSAMSNLAGMYSRPKAQVNNDYPDGGYPVYSAAILTEFFIDRRAGGTDEVFRVLYHDSENSDFRVITPYVEGCTDDYCPVEVLERLAAKYAPPGGIDAFCQQRIAM